VPCSSSVPQGQTSRKEGKEGKVIAGRGSIKAMMLTCLALRAASDLSFLPCLAPPLPPLTGSLTTRPAPRRRTGTALSSSHTSHRGQQQKP
jgi:hypothetical protein